VILNERSDLTLSALRRVAWEGEGVELGGQAIDQMDRSHESFATYVSARLAEDPGAMIYGVTTGPGDAGTRNLTEEAAAERPTRLWTAASFGEPLPERVVRGIVLARLANFVEGHATARSEVGRAIAAMLDEKRLPFVPAQGNGGAGEVLALGHLFYDLSARLELTPKERMALINGSPCAAALVGDAALAAAGRTVLAETVFALATEAIRAPLEAYSSDVELLWGDEQETAALASLRRLLEGHREERLAYQPPVSFRILGRVLGQARRARSEAEQAASTALQSVTDNPVYIPPDPSRPLGTVFSTGGYHNSRATAALDGLAFAWADLCQLAQRQGDVLFQHPSTAPVLSSVEWADRPLHMVQNGWAEEARALAQPTLLSLGSFGQNDVPAQTFLAWRKAMAVGLCLDASLAVLATLAAHALHGAGQAAPPRLAELMEDVLASVPPVSRVRRLGPDCGALSAAFTGSVFSARFAQSVAAKVGK
jgi:histidine ammonia-lyase